MNIIAKESVENKAESGSSQINLGALLLDSFAAAELLGFTRQYFYELSKSGRLGPEPIYFGKRSRWSRFELIEWVQAGCPNREKWICIKEQKLAV